MFDFTDYNKRVLSVAFFWMAIGFALCGVGYFLHRISTPLPASNVSPFGVFLRTLFPFLLSFVAGILSRYFYTHSSSPTPLKENIAGNFPHYADTENEKDSPKPPLPSSPPSGHVHASNVPESHVSPQETPSPESVHDTVPDPKPAPVVEHGSDESFYAARKQGKLSEKDAHSPILQRVQKIMLQSYTDVALLDSSETEYENESDIDPSVFVIQAAKDGGFSDSSTVEKIYDRITKSIPKGQILWGMQEKLSEDKLVFSKKKPFPKFLFPEIPRKIITSDKEAVEAYQKKKFVVGQDAYDNPIEIDPKKSPHGLVIGGTGSGKSVFTLGLIEDLRSQGWQIVICDGKQTDYTALINVPNVIAIGSKIEDWVRITQFVEEQMTARYVLSGERARKGLSPKFNQPPMLFLLDEFGSIRREVKSRFGKAGLDQFDNILKNIAAKARAAGIHMVIATQDIFSSTFDGDLRANLSFIVSLGMAEQRTLADAFSNETRAKARRIGQSIQEEDKGRGIIEIGTDDGKAVAEFQTYFAYSPGAEMVTFEPAKSEWEKYKQEVSDKIPLLYPRMWYLEPEPDILKDIDDLDELKGLTFFPIQNKDGSIIPSKVEYDAASDDYIGRQVTSTAQLLGFVEEDVADSHEDPRTEALVEHSDEHWVGEQLERSDDLADEQPDFDSVVSKDG